MQYYLGKTETGWLTKFLADAYVGYVVAAVYSKYSAGVSFHVHLTKVSEFVWNLM